MDEKPFFIFSIVDYSDQDISELEKFSASNFSVNGIISAASDLKLKSLITEALRKEFGQPTDDFIRLIGRRVHEGNMTSEVRLRYGLMIVSCIGDILRDQANQRLKEAIDGPRLGQVVSVAPIIAIQESEVDQEKGGSVTTEEEHEAFRIVKAILRKNVDLKRIFIRDAASYCAIILDDNNRKPVCRLYFNGKRKRISIFLNKIEVKHDIADLEDIYGLGDEIQKSIVSYLSPSF